MSASKLSTDASAATANSKGLTTEQAMEAVFTNDMLVEEILTRTIRSNGGFSQNDKYDSNKNTPRLSTADILKLRLVCKSWNLVISKLHRKGSHPLFHLPLTRENCSDLLTTTVEEDNNNSTTTCVEEGEMQSLLTAFLTAMQGWGYSSLHKSEEKKSQPIPAFHLCLTPSFFTVANLSVYDALYSFLLTHAPDSMTNFTFNFHRNRFDYIPTTFPSFSFHRLTHVQLVIERMAWSFIPLIQKILEGASNLHTLDFTSSSCIVTYSAPHLNDVIDFIAKSRPYSIRLPENTRKIMLYGTTDSCSCFYRVPLDNLGKLESLALSASSCIIRQLDDIFTCVAGRLRHLHFIGFSSCVYLFNRNYQINPVPMPKLETLTVTMPWEIRPSLLFRYNTHLPSLKELVVIHHEGDEAFHRFLDNDKESLTVERCTMIAIKPHVHAENGFRSTSQRIDVTKLAVIKSIKECFPNLAHLGIGVTAGYIEGLEFVFSQMTTLKSLAIYIESNSKFKTTICWDSLFTGLSDTACDAMTRYDIPGYWDTICLLDDKFPSLRDLKNLEALYLVETSYPSCRAFSFGENGSGGSGHGSCDFEKDTLPEKGDHLFSELSFHFAFYRMPKLSMLACTKGFMPSERIQKKWFAEKGMKIKRIRSPKPYHLLTAKFSLFDNTWYSD